MFILIVISYDNSDNRNGGDMKALIMTDIQKVITSHKDFGHVLENIKRIEDVCRQKGYEIIFIRHLSDQEDGFNRENSLSAIDYEVKDGDLVIEKKTPSMFKDTNLDQILKARAIEEIIMVGFNTEFCCLFSTIAAFDRGYKVTFVEDAIGTCSSPENYEMPGLDINDFVGSFLDWSGAVRVEYTEDLYGEI